MAVFNSLRSMVLLGGRFYSYSTKIVLLHNQSRNEWMLNCSVKKLGRSGSHMEILSINPAYIIKLAITTNHHLASLSLIHI